VPETWLERFIDFQGLINKFLGNRAGDQTSCGFLIGYGVLPGFEDYFRIARHLGETTV
jgi:hypothetical protein